MPDWEEMMRNAKEDVLCAIEAWREVLQETFGSRLDYAYTKGSALKKWDSCVDYVPVLSDVDIHIMMTDSDPLFKSTADGFASSIKVSKMFEDRFRELRGEHLHIPRSQVIHLNPQLDNPLFSFPQASDVHIMVGVPKDGTIPSDDEVRANDYNELQELSTYLADLPRQSFDRVGLDFWALLRRMCWRVSPTPIRLLTQDYPHPLEVWKWNRTSILEELREREFVSIADSYQKYYETGWQLFLTGFTGYTEIRETVVHGYAVLQGCYDAVTKLRL
jgi:hypothetical protein